MRIEELVWDETNETHIARHNVKPEEVEEVVFDSSSKFLRTRRREILRFLALGLTEAGRYLFVVMEPLPRNQAYVITARDMSDEERRRFKSK